MTTTRVNCKYCNKKLESENKYLNRSKFCSIKCSTKFNEKTKRQPNKACAWCSSLFYRKPSKKPSKSGLYFCCRKHKDAAQRLDGLSGLTPKHYGHGNTTQSYRAKAFRVYKPKCNRCNYNKLQSALEVHHKDRNRNNNHINNLEILCKNCHYEEHAEEKRTRVMKRLHKEDFNFKIKWPKLDDLKAMVNSSSYIAVAKKLGVSDTAVKYHIRKRDPNFKKGK